MFRPLPQVLAGAILRAIRDERPVGAVRSAETRSVGRHHGRVENLYEKIVRESPVRVLMVTDFYEPFRGGVEHHVRTLSHALVERGHDVAVATLAAGDLPVGLDHDGPVRVHRFRGTVPRLPGLFLDDERPWAPPVPDPAVVVGLRPFWPRSART